MKTTARRPFSHTRLTRFLEKRILELRPRKSQIEIASEAGFVQTNMLAMIKNGSTKLPLDRVPGLALALECDARRLFLLAMEQLEHVFFALRISSAYSRKPRAISSR